MRKSVLLVIVLFLISPALAEEQGNVIVKRAHLNMEAMNVKNPYIHNTPEVIFYLRNNGSISAVIINATLTYGTEEALPEIVPSAIPSGYISMLSFKFKTKIDCSALSSPIPLTLSVYYYASEGEIQQLTYQDSITPADPYQDLLITPALGWTVSRDQTGSHYSTGTQYSMEIGRDYSLSYSLINLGAEELRYRINVSYDPSYLFVISSTPEGSYQRSELASSNFSLSGGEATPWKHTFTPISACTTPTQVKIQIEDLTDGGCANLNKDITFDVVVSVSPGPFGMYITRGLDEVDFFLILLLALGIFVKFYKKNEI